MSELPIPNEKLPLEDAWRAAHIEQLERLSEMQGRARVELDLAHYALQEKRATSEDRIYYPDTSQEERDVELAEIAVDSLYSQRKYTSFYKDATLEILEHFHMTKKSRTERPADYPERYPVSDVDAVIYVKDFLFFPSTVIPENYDPPYYTAPKILENTKGYADPEVPESGGEFTKEYFTDLVSYAQRPYVELHEKPATRYVQGKGYLPANPICLTGITGRGVLGKWGANFAADPIISRNNPDGGELEIAMILRDNGEWAIPGGMVDAGEDVSRTIEREFEEEAGVLLDMTKATLVYQGYVDDPRNTDNAWMETTAKHLHLDADSAAGVKLSAGSDAKAVQWMPATDENLSRLFASHEQIIRKALALHTSAE